MHSIHYYFITVILDAKEPHGATCKAIDTIPDHFMIMDANTRSTIDKGIVTTQNSLLAREWRQGSLRLGHLLDATVPTRAGMKSVDIQPLESAGEEERDSEALAKRLCIRPTSMKIPSAIVVKLALVMAEVRRTGLWRWPTAAQLPATRDGHRRSARHRQ